MPKDWPCDTLRLVIDNAKVIQQFDMRLVTFPIDKTLQENCNSYERLSGDYSNHRSVTNGAGRIVSNYTLVLKGMYIIY